MTLQEQVVNNKWVLADYIDRICCYNPYPHELMERAADVMRHVRRLMWPYLQREPNDPFRQYYSAPLLKLELAYALADFDVGEELSFQGALENLVSYIAYEGKAKLLKDVFHSVQ